MHDREKIRETFTENALDEAFHGGPRPDLAQRILDRLRESQLAQPELAVQPLHVLPARRRWLAPLIEAACIVLIGAAVWLAASAPSRPQPQPTEDPTTSTPARPMAHADTSELPPLRVPATAKEIEKWKRKLTTVLDEVRATLDRQDDVSLRLEATCDQLDELRAAGAPRAEQQRVEARLRHLVDWSLACELHLGLLRERAAELDQRVRRGLILTREQEARDTRADEAERDSERKLNDLARQDDKLEREIRRANKDRGEAPKTNRAPSADEGEPRKRAQDALKRANDKLQGK